MSGVKVRVISGCMCRGEHLAAGALVTLDELAVCDLLDAGRVALVNEGDAPQLRAFRLARERKILASLGPMPQPAGSPWQEWRR